MTQYNLDLPFYIDTDGYTNRDREMFVCGFEFCMIIHEIEHHDYHGARPIHRENEDRFRMNLGQRKIKFDIWEYSAQQLHKEAASINQEEADIKELAGWLQLLIY